MAGSSGAAAVLWQQLERVSVTRADDGEMAAVERGDPDRTMPLGQAITDASVPPSRKSA